MGNSLYLLCKRGAGAAAYDATSGADPDNVYGACEEPLSSGSDGEGDETGGGSGGKSRRENGVEEDEDFGGDQTVYESRVARAAAAALAKAAATAFAEADSAEKTKSAATADSQESEAATADSGAVDPGSSSGSRNC